MPQIAKGLSFAELDGYVKRFLIKSMLMEWFE